jgi:hypothetical protein
MASTTREGEASMDERNPIRDAVLTGLAGLTERIGGRGLVLGVVALLVVAAVLLPPVSLLNRLGIVGYESLSADRVSVSHADGIILQVDPESFSDRLRVRVDSVPRLEFLEGSAGRRLKKAAQALPDHLVVKSPYYTIDTRGKSSGPVWIDVVLPNDAEPWETLDLYSWDGVQWTWIGSDLHPEVAEHEFIRAEVSRVPPSVVVMQAKSEAPPMVSTTVDADDGLSQVHLFDAVNPTGLLLGTMGGFAGDLSSLVVPGEDTGCSVLPALRNWAPGRSVNQGLLSDLLNDPEIQQEHIANIVQMCSDQGFDGVEIDYRGVTAEQRDSYAAFVQALSEAFHEADLWLGVTVERPTPADGGWYTGGYDLVALGAAADSVKVPFPEDPAAYVEGGKADWLFNWVTAQVPRYKLAMLVSSLSATAAEGAEGYEYVSLEEALAPFGEISVLGEGETVEPESEVAFGLSGSLLSTTPQPQGGTYQLRYKTEAGDVRTVWLGTAAGLATKLSWAQKYQIGGICVADALDPGNAEGVMDVVAGVVGVETPSLPSLEEMQIAWTVASEGRDVDAQSGPLANPSFTWTASETPGAYTVSAQVVGFDHGSMTITVAEPEPELPEVASRTITGTATITETGTVTETGEVGEASGQAGGGEAAASGQAECLDARYLADITIPDNTQMDKGEAFEKTWQMENIGTCAWPEGTVLAFVGGEQMGAPNSVDVVAVEPDGKKDITVPMTAPDQDGTYTGKWQLRSGETLFGGQVWVTIVVGEPQQAAPAPVPAPAGGGGFELGGHIRDGNFPYADKMHYAGMNWAKVQVHYPQDASGIIAAAHGRGFKIQLSALGTPGMVTQGGFEQDFANWVAGLAAAGADAIEVWNEPNIDREWQIGHISPAAYTNLLCAAYRAIKNANSGTAVISAAPAPTGSFGGACQPNGGNCDDLPFLQGMYNAGAAQCMDYIGAHHNSGATSPSARSGHPADSGGQHHSWYFLPQTELYYQVFGGARKLFYTEMGYASQEGVPAFSDWFAWARGTNNSQQAAWLAEAVRLSINTGMVRCIIVWNIDFVRYGYDPQDGYAIIRPGGGCPACDALHGVLGTR